MKTACTLLLIFVLQTAQAAVISENFLTTTQKDSSTAVWNFATGFIHPTLQVSNYQTLSGPVTTIGFDVGDGSDGPFNVSTYANFGTVIGSVITIDALQHPVLKFSSFQLDAGYTLTAVNGPLVIYSLSTVDISGTIQCSGGNGSAAAGVTGGTGGLGRCGGSNGGNGGNSTGSGGSGLPLAGGYTGGGGGIYGGVAPGAGGGGGGSYAGNAGLPGANSVPANNTGGSAGTAGPADDDMTILNGSPGGGGGSGSNTEGGGGGGAGGGLVIIHAVGNVSINTSGFILALGGNGGGANSGGGGGGGAGGSVQIFTGGDMHLDTGTDIDVNGGLGAIPAVGNAGDGGDGTFGRTWDVSATFSGSGSESHLPPLISFGTIEYSTAPQVVISKSYDTQSTLAQFQSITASPASTDIAFEVSGSSDNFVSDDSGWVPVTLLTTLNKKRYLKFRMTLTNSNPATPTQVDDVSMNYDPGIKEDFQFKSGCGRVGSLPPNSPSGLILALLLLPLLLAYRLKAVGSQQKN